MVSLVLRIPVEASNVRRLLQLLLLVGAKQSLVRITLSAPFFECLVAFENAAASIQCLAGRSGSV